MFQFHISSVQVHELSLPVVAAVRFVGAGIDIIGIPVDRLASLHQNPFSTMAERTSFVLLNILFRLDFLSDHGNKLRYERRRIFGVI